MAQLQGIDMNRNQSQVACCARGARDSKCQSSCVTGRLGCPLLTEWMGVSGSQRLQRGGAREGAGAEEAVRQDEDGVSRGEAAGQRHHLLCACSATPIPAIGRGTASPRARCSTPCVDSARVMLLDFDRGLPAYSRPLARDEGGELSCLPVDPSPLPLFLLRNPSFSRLAGVKLAAYPPTE